MLTTTLRRNRGDRAFDQLQQRLLHTFTRDIASDRRVVRLARNLIDFIDIDDTHLGLFYIVIALLQQLLDDILNVFAHVPGFSQRGSVRDGEGNIQQPGQRLRK